MRRYISALVCALLISGCATKSLEWQRHTGDDFPTRVNWIISPKGNVLDANGGLQYGSWTVISGEGGPYATYQCPQDGICEINISNLQCQQSTGGPNSCELILYKNAICELVIPKKKETLNIGCPIDVAFAPKGNGETASPGEAAAAAAAAAAAKGVQETAAITPATEAKGAVSPSATAATREQAKGQSVAGDFVFGLRAGLVGPTQQILENLSSGTSLGPLVNLEAYYVLREWIRLGMMFEWHQYDISSRNGQLGTLSTISLLPTVEFRPTRNMMRGVGFGWLIPYASLGTGVNVHSFSNATGLGNEPVSFPSTFAFRVAAGLDFPITSYLAVNAEVAWKKDSGNFERSGVENNFNASPLMFLLGLRAHF
jgi:hypothetical protein